MSQKTRDDALNIKRVIQFSFSFIILLVISIGLINTLTIKKIEHNAEFKDLIHSLINIQEEINTLTLKAINTTNIKSRAKILDSINEKAEHFQALEQRFFINQKRSFIDDFVIDLLKQSSVKESFTGLKEHKQDLQKYYDQFTKIKKERAQILKNINSIKKIEKNLQATINKEILFTNSVYTIQEFSHIKNLKDQAVKNYTNKNRQKEFEINVTKLYQKTSIKTLNNYKQSVGKLINYSKRLKQITAKEIKLKQKIKVLIQANHKDNKTSIDNIEALHHTILKENNITLFSLLGITILFIILLSIKVSKNVALSVDEIHKKVEEGIEQIDSLHDEIEETQREIIFTMGAIGENRSKETGNHVKRVAEYSKLLALYYGLDHKEAEMLKYASPMHDIGKVAIPDSVLNKPGKFDESEREVMNTHAKLGYDMLKHSDRPLLKMAATVAYEHHEKWDGTGYPRGLQGEDIHIYGRITAIADIFDALGSDRVYKKAWSDERIFKLFKDESGKHFDPKLIDLFFENLDSFLKIRERFKDEFKA